MGKRTAAACAGMTALLFTARARSQSQEVEVSPPVREPRPSFDPSRIQDPDAKEPTERPRPRGLVFESTVGVLGFAGSFRHVAPPAYWFHTQAGYELTRALMVFVSGDVAFTDTSESQTQANTYGIVLWGVGGGLRATVHFSERFAVYGQGELGAFSADVKHDELAARGFASAETVNPAVGARLGVEWYQTDRHLALSAVGGGRYAQGLARNVGPRDVPLLWDAGLSLRYGF